MCSNKKGFTMFKGLRTAIYYADDMEATKAWYQRALGIAPYFESPQYVGFEVGGFELGLDRGSIPTTEQPAGALVYWGVDSIDEALKHLIALGAKEHLATFDAGEGILLATVIDPFGNVFGVIQNPNFKITP